MKKRRTLTDGRIVVRPCRLDDLEPGYAAVRESITELAAWQPWCHARYSLREYGYFLENAVISWEKNTAYNFSILDASDGCFLGGCGLNRLNWVDRLANLGYWVRTSRTRRGIAARATRLLAEFGFRELNMNRLEIIAAAGNEASRRAAEKAGATFEGILRNRFTMFGRLHDAALFSLVPADITTVL